MGYFESFCFTMTDIKFRFQENSLFQTSNEPIKLKGNSLLKFDCSPILKTTHFCVYSKTPLSYLLCTMHACIFFSFRMFYQISFSVSLHRTSYSYPFVFFFHFISTFSFFFFFFFQRYISFSHAKKRLNICIFVVYK